MASPTLDVSYTGTSKPSDKLLEAHSKLPPEILITIFEEVLGKYPAIASLRLVSKQFNDLILPISYRHIVLNDRIVDFSTCDYKNETVSSHKMQVQRDASRYAQHITIKRDFHEGILHKLLLSLTSFRSLTISYRAPYSSKKTVGSTISHAPSIDAFLLCLARFKNTWPTLRIHVENLDTTEWQMPQIQALHASQMRSLKIEEWYKGDPNPDLEGLAVKKLLLNMRELKVLHLKSFHSEVTISDSNLSVAERLPALEELVLHGYDWQFSAITAVTFWDWTNITYLELERVPIVPFLRTVTLENLLHLKTFVSDSYSEDQIFDWDEANDLLCKLVRLILNPEKLGIRVCRELHKDHNIDPIADCVRAIATHGQSLKSLDFLEHWTRDHDRHRDVVRDWKKDLLILQSCSNLMELTLDDGILALQVQQDFTADALAEFRNLRRLKVYASFFGDMHLESQQETVEKTQITIRAWIKRLVAHKKGAKFERLSLNIRVFHKRSPGMTVPLVNQCRNGSFFRDTKPNYLERLTYTYEDGNQTI